MHYAVNEIGPNVFDYQYNYLRTIFIFHGSPITLHRDAINKLPNLQFLYVCRTITYCYRSFKTENEPENAIIDSGTVHGCPLLELV